MKDIVKAAVVQASSVPFDVDATTAKAVGLISEAAGKGAELVVFPEAFIGTYPKGLTFDTPVGERTAEGRAEYLRYYNASVELDGPQVATLKKAASTHGIFIVVGIIERLGGTLYCSALYIDPKQGLVGMRRKLMPTGAERLIWGFGDGSTLDVVDSSLGRIGAVICWENYMPLLRTAMYGQGIEIYCTPTADSRPAWQSSMVHIALEGRCFVLSACQFITRDEYPNDYRSALHGQSGDIVMRGGSVIVDPAGKVLAGPAFDKAEILYADLDGTAIPRGRFDFDAVGHYARPDVFQLKVDTQKKSAVSFS